MKPNPLTPQKFPRKIFTNPKKIFINSKNFFKIPVQKFSLNIGPGTYNYYNYIYIIYNYYTYFYYML